jgi:hypothetical protein
MASSTLESLFINSNSSSNNLSKILERENNSFEDLILDEDNAPSLPSSSSEHPAKRRKLWAINIWKLRREPTNKEPLLNSKGRRY